MPNDLWWHLRIGDEIAAAHSIPQIDSFSWTMNGAEYRSYSSFWLSDLVMLGAFRALGVRGNVLLNGLAVLLAYVGVAVSCRINARSWRVVAIGVAFALALGCLSWSVRPQTLAYPLAAGILVAIHGHRSGRIRWLIWLAPAALALWANLHGSWVVGLGLLGIWVADAAWGGGRVGGYRGLAAAASTPAAVFTLSCLSVLANPRGPGIVSYVVGLSSDPAVREFVMEWEPATLQRPIGAIFLVALLGSALVLAMSPRRPSLFDALTLILFGLLGIQAVRGSVWFGMAMAPVLVSHLQASFDLRKAAHPLESQRTVGRRGLTVSMLVACLVVGAAATPWGKQMAPLGHELQAVVAPFTPTKAVEYLLRERPRGRLYNELGFGSYLIWAAQPGYPVFVDPRFELYPPELWEDYFQISEARPGWESLLDRYSVDLLMLSPDLQPRLVAALDTSNEWTLIYSDDHAVLFGRAGLR
jgi:hypothetical protein